MKAGNDAAGCGDEHEGKRGYSRRVHTAESAPDFRNGVLRPDNDAAGHSCRHKYQTDTEDGADPADEFINGEERGNEVVNQNHTQPEPGGGQHSLRAALPEQSDDQARRAHGERGAQQDQQYQTEYTRDILDGAAQIYAGGLGDGAAAGTGTHHTGKVVVDAAGQQCAEGDPQKDHRAP